MQDQSLFKAEVGYRSLKGCGKNLKTGDVRSQQVLGLSKPGSKILLQGDINHGV